MFSTGTVTLFVACIVACEACQGNMRNREERQRLLSARTAIAEGDTAGASQLTGGGEGAGGGGRSASARSPAVARARARAAARAARSRTADGQTRAVPTPTPRG